MQTRQRPRGGTGLSSSPRLAKRHAVFALLTEVAENRARSLAAHHAGPSARDAVAHRERPQRTAPTRPQAGARAAHPTPDPLREAVA